MKNGVEEAKNSQTDEYFMYAAYPGAKMLLTVAGQPLYRIMAEQQVSGLSIMKTIKNIARQGPKAFFYGLSPTMLKEGQKSLAQMIALRNAENWTSSFLSQFVPALSDSKTAKAIGSGSILATAEWLLGTPFGRYATWASSQDRHVHFGDFCREIFNTHRLKPFPNQVAGILHEAYKAGGVNLVKQWVAGSVLFSTNAFMHHHLAAHEKDHADAVAWSVTIVPALAASLTSIPLEVIKTRMQNTTGKADGLKEQLIRFAENPKNAMKGLFPKSVLVLIGNIIAVKYLNKSKALDLGKENKNPPSTPPAPPTIQTLAVSSQPSVEEKEDNAMKSLSQRLHMMNLSLISQLSLDKILRTHTHFRLFSHFQQQLHAERPTTHTIEAKLAKLHI